MINLKRNYSGTVLSIEPLAKLAFSSVEIKNE